MCCNNETHIGVRRVCGFYVQTSDRHFTDTICKATRCTVSGAAWCLSLGLACITHAWMQKNVDCWPHSTSRKRCQQHWAPRQSRDDLLDEWRMTVATDGTEYWSQIAFWKSSWVIYNVMEQLLEGSSGDRVGNQIGILREHIVLRSSKRQTDSSKTGQSNVRIWIDDLSFPWSTASDYC